MIWLFVSHFTRRFCTFVCLLPGYYALSNLQYYIADSKVSRALSAGGVFRGWMSANVFHTITIYSDHLVDAETVCCWSIRAVPSAILSQLSAIGYMVMVERSSVVIEL